jgi:hypothetical protein
MTVAAQTLSIYVYIKGMKWLTKDLKSLTLKNDTIRSSETLVYFYRTTRLHNLEYYILNYLERKKNKMLFVMAYIRRQKTTV